MQITAELAHFIASTNGDALPPDTIQRAKRAVLDTLGVMLAGSSEDCARIAAELAQSEEARPVSTVVGQGFRTSPRNAAFANGVAAHALDYDDVNSAMTGHPSVPLVPAVLAVAEETGASGRDMLAAFVLGFEVEVKLGKAIGRSHYARGWHATATLGTLAAAVAASKLYGLSTEQIRMSLGIATSLSGGSRQNFGTMTKPLHPGQAAQNGLIAAQLAARGFTADADIIEAPLGFLNLFSPDDDARPELVLEGLGSEFEILTSGISVKQYPCCFGTHRALEATLALSDEYHLDARHVERVEVLIPRGAGAPLIHPRPMTGLEGKFSMEYCVAAALLDGKVGLDAFEDESVRRAPAQELLRRVEMLTDTTESAPAEGFSEVTITMRDGGRVSRRIDEPRGSAVFPLSIEELISKYRDCATRVLGTSGAAHSADLILGLDALPSVLPLTEALLSRATSAVR